MNKTFKIRGLEIEEIMSDNCLFWRIHIKSPFYQEGKYWFSINDKVFEEAKKQGIDKFIIKIGEKPEMFMPVLSKKELRTKRINGEYEAIPSKWYGLSPWLRYLFPIK